MKFGKPKFKPPKAKGKLMLPNRAAVSALTKGGAGAQSIGNYAKLTPSGANAPATYPAIMQEGDEGASAAPDE